jgi:hypothetical protein
MTISLLTTCCVFSIIASGTALAQTTSTSATHGGGFFDATLEHITGRPFSAEQVNEQVRTLADKTHITQTTHKIMLYRDAAGRTRIELSFLPPLGAVKVPSPNFIMITDSVAGYSYILNQHEHVAQRMAWPPGARRTSNTGSAPSSTTTDASQLQRSANSMLTNASAAASTTPSAQPHPEMAEQSLGTRVIEGINAEGTRTTITYPGGSLGNDRPLTVISETWISPELKVTVLLKTSDPQNGDTITKLTNIVQAEPDPLLFQIPADYSVVDQNQQQTGDPATPNPEN